MSLTKACLIGDLNEVKRLIEECREDVNKTDTFSHTPLYNAIISGNEKIAQYLNNCDNIRYQDNDIKLIYKEGKLDLLESTTDQDSPHWLAAMHFACKYDRLNIVKFLIKVGRVNQYSGAYGPCDEFLWMNYLGYTALTAASTEDSISVFKHLIQTRHPLRDIEVVNLPDLNGDTPLTAACKKVSLNVIKYILNNLHYSVCFSPRWDRNLYAAAKINDWLDILEDLLGSKSIHEYLSYYMSLDMQLIAACENRRRL